MKIIKTVLILALILGTLLCYLANYRYTSGYPLTSGGDSRSPSGAYKASSYLEIRRPYYGKEIGLLVFRVQAGSIKPDRFVKEWVTVVSDYKDYPLRLVRPQFDIEWSENESMVTFSKKGTVLRFNLE